jgi:formate dehydrogenase (hydrogenase)
MALGMFSCSKATNETNYLAQKFARTALGTNNIDSCNRT